jgi:hypothetical protein
MHQTLAVVSLDDILRRIRGEYLEMPGLRLTSAQARRLWALDAALCGELLESLTAQGFLQRRSDGTYGRASDGAPAAPRLRMLKANAPAESLACARRP